MQDKTNLLEEEMASYVAKFYPGSISEMQHQLNVLPSAKLAQKFNYFYKPYNFDINIQRFMKFNEEDEQDTDFQKLEALKME